MTNRTKELFDLAQNEPDSIDDIAEQLEACDPSERDHILGVVNAIGDAFTVLNGDNKPTASPRIGA